MKSMAGLIHGQSVKEWETKTSNNSIPSRGDHEGCNVVCNWSFSEFNSVGPLSLDVCVVVGTPEGCGYLRKWLLIINPFPGGL